MPAHSENTYFYNGNSIGTYLYKDNFIVTYGFYSQQGAGVNDSPDNAPGISVGNSIYRGSTPVWVLPNNSTENVYLNQDDNITNVGGYLVSGRQLTQRSDLFSVLCNVSTGSYLYYEFSLNQEAVYADPDPTKLTDIRSYSLVFGSTASSDSVVKIPLWENESILDYYIGSNYYAGMPETLAGLSLYLVPPDPTLSDSLSKYDKGFWKGKKKIDYIDQPNVFAYPDLTQELKNVPVMVAKANPETKKIELQDDIIVDKVYPLLPDATVLAASYYPV